MMKTDRPNREVHLEEGDTTPFGESERSATVPTPQGRGPPSAQRGPPNAIASRGPPNAPRGPPNAPPTGARGPPNVPPPPRTTRPSPPQVPKPRVTLSMQDVMNAKLNQSLK